MNSGTKNPTKAGKLAQQLADDYNLPAYVFFPATGAGGNLHVELIPTWHIHRQKQWAIEKERQGATVYWPKGLNARAAEGGVL